MGHQTRNQRGGARGAAASLFEPSPPKTPTLLPKKTKRTPKTPLNLKFLAKLYLFVFKITLYWLYGLWDTHR